MGLRSRLVRLTVFGQFGQKHLVMALATFFVVQWWLWKGRTRRRDSSGQISEGLGGARSHDIADGNIFDDEESVKRLHARPYGTNPTKTNRAAGRLAVFLI